MSSAPSPSETPRRRLPLFPRSFRGLVTAWNTVTLLLFTVALLFGLRYGLSYTMLREEDKLQAADTTEVGLFVAQDAPRWDRVQDALDRKAHSHIDRKWFGEVRDPTGNVLARSGVPPVPLPPAGEEVAAPRTMGGYRVTRKRVLTEGAGELIIDVGASLDEIDEDVTRLTQLMVIAGAVLLIFAPLGGFWLAGRVIKPLADIISTTARLRPRNLHERLPLRHTGDELDRLSETINGFLDRIADHLARHRELTANAAHELRSPLAAILSSAEVALNQERTPEEYKELLGAIVEECGRLGSLVQQLLLLAESDAGRLAGARERVDLGGLARKAVEMFRGVAESRGVDLRAEAPEPVWVCGDPGQLRQVVFNLIDNAVKFTTAGGVTVAIRGGQAGVELEVTDTGVGIPPENLPYVFDRFFRGDQSRTRLATGGSGLGLSICQALVASHGGHIVVTSEEGRGTRVRVTLPAA
jgi:two-component system heavy metal sensor histidine kinase CusS